MYNVHVYVYYTGIQHPLSQVYRMSAGYPGPLPHPHQAHYHHPSHPHLAVRFDAGGHPYMNWVSYNGRVSMLDNSVNSLLHYIVLITCSMQIRLEIEVGVPKPEMVWTCPPSNPPCVYAS